jgi:hypothetical protein
MRPISGGGFCQAYGEDEGENYSNRYRQGVTMHYSEITDVKNNPFVLLES